MDDKEKRRRRSYIKLNIMSLFFTAVSFISVTLAWFAYSGLVTTKTEVNVKAWYIEFNKNGKAVSNNIIISLSDIYPGMDIMSETIDIKNSGDSDAMIDYKIKSVRILDDVYEAPDHGTLEDEISHNYPFHINMSLSNTYANANDGTGNFTVSVSWPLDSNNDAADTEWGNKAYDFQQEEAKKLSKDASYQVRSAIEVVISLEAIQYVGEGDAPDIRYRLGNIQLFDVVSNKVCTEISSSCIKTYIIDKNNKLSDSSVTLLPDLYSSYPEGTFSEYDTLYSSLTNNWTVVHRSLGLNDIIPVISNDVTSSVIVGNDISNQLIGFVDYGNRVETTVDNAIKYNGYFRFKNDKFTYLSSSNCYWLGDNYSEDTHFALVKVDNLFSKVYGENKTSTCKVIPVLEVSKSVLNNESSS